MERPRDRKRVEFYADLRNGKRAFIIREVSLNSQDSVTTDPEVVDFFKQRLIGDGYIEGVF